MDVVRIFSRAPLALALTIAALYSQSAWCGKVEDIQATIKKTCSKDVSNADALRLVKNLYISCAAGQKVDVDGCQVTCLKENSGAVVGQ